ncbi:MAG: type II CRISPR RNA-guided endonuclease Cas9 [Sneathiella sp.]|nr:MAG: type II CRISPR RNA-guided endonuclease Cas9 [Sneathiella sp.]
MSFNTPWRLGIDLGTNSLGWAALELNNDCTGVLTLIDSGVRIFSDGRNPKDKQSNAAKRREPRSARKNRDRSKRRSARLMRELTEFSLMPSDANERKKLEGGKGIPQQETDPWILRYRALNEEISPHQLGRAIFHLHQRRGFKSNRKTDRADNESGKVHDATKRTKDDLEKTEAKTLGALFGKPRYEVALHNMNAAKGERKPQPLARVRTSGTGAKQQYDYYPTRAMILNEFTEIWDAQKQYHPELLSDTAHKHLYDTIERQHPLKPPKVGKCTLVPEEPRAAKALPSSQRARIFQEVNALRLMQAGEAQRPLSKEQRDVIANRLLSPTSKTAKVTFKQLKKLLKLPDSDRFTLESEKRKDLQGEETTAKLMQENRWGPAWLELDLASRDEIVGKLVDEEDEEKLIGWLCETHKLDKDQAYRIADCPLPDGYGHLSQKALTRILPPLEADVTVYSDAVTQAGFDSHSHFGTGEVFDKALPYYGYILERSVAFGTGELHHSDEKRYGKVANPTVHVALNQIRSVINDLMARYGPPEQIVVELARDLPLSAKGKNDLEKQQKANQAANENRRKILEEMGVHNTYENRLRLRLFEDLEALGKRCPFSGEQINLTDLFSDKIEIEHILPFSLTLDDSYSNKTLATRKANRDKKNQTPFEAFSHSPDEYDWQEISNRAAELPRNKQWRFGPDAMDRFTEENGFLARQLTDTQYISRLAKTYLEAIYGGQGYKGAKNHVHVIPGRLTADLRHIWGLNSVLRGHNEPESEAQKKNREDHRHHALDAIVVACTDMSMLQMAARRAKENENIYSRKLMTGLEEPWPGFRNDVETSIRKIIVSHKPDHGFQGAMHNDTAFGIPKGDEGKPDKKGVRTVVTRKPLDSDSFKSPKDLTKIRDDIIRNHLEEETFGLSGADFKLALVQAGKAMTPPVYKVRIEDNLRVIPFKDKSGKEYKAYQGDSNYCYDIWRTDKGKWTGEVISTYQAYQLARKDKDWWQRLEGQDGQQLRMRLRKKDYLQIEHQGTAKIVQIYKFSEGKINMSEHHEANASARVKDKDLPAIQMAPSSLQNAKAKYVTVSPSGVPKVHQYMT